MIQSLSTKYTYLQIVRYGDRLEWRWRNWKVLQSVLELHNPTDSAIDIGGWWIDDLENGGSPMCNIAGTVMEPGSYVVFYRAQTQIN